MKNCLINSWHNSENIRSLLSSDEIIIISRISLVIPLHFPFLLVSILNLFASRPSQQWTDSHRIKTNKMIKSSFSWKFLKVFTVSPRGRCWEPRGSSRGWLRGLSGRSHSPRTASPPPPSPVTSPPPPVPPANLLTDMWGNYSDQANITTTTTITDWDKMSSTNKIPFKT